MIHSTETKNQTERYRIRTNTFLKWKNLKLDKQQTISSKEGPSLKQVKRQDRPNIDRNKTKPTTSDCGPHKEYNGELKWCSKGLAWPELKIHCIARTQITKKTDNVDQLSLL